MDNDQLIVCAHDQYDFIDKLYHIDIRVPKRSMGRTTREVEYYSICYLLSTLSQYDRLRYPIKIYHRDRPDFFIDMPNDSIGVEVTEAVTENLARFEALVEREAPDAQIELAHFRWGLPRLSVTELRIILEQAQLESDGWVGDGPEREWSEALVEIIRYKALKMAQPSFRNYDKNLLLIYDNLPIPPINYKRAMTLL